MNLGQTICQLRTKRNMSQGDLANALDVSRQSISKWETNTSVPELDKLIKLSELFEVSLDELILNQQPKDAIVEEPAILYGQKSMSVNKPKTAGIILLCFAALIVILLSALGDIAAGLVYSTPFLICGIICFVAKNHAGLWCSWVTYFTADLYFRFAAGINLNVILWAVRLNRFDIRFVLALGLLIFYLTEVVITVLRFRSTPLANCAKNRIILVTVWILYALTFLPVRPDLSSVESTNRYMMFTSIQDIIALALVPLALTLSVRFIISCKNRKT